MTAGVLVAFGIRHLYAVMALGLCAFVMVTILSEFLKGAGTIRSKSGQNWLAAMVELTHRNTRRYGGYIVHVGIVAMFVGFTGAAFNRDATVEVKVGDSFKLAAYDLRVREIKNGGHDEASNYSWGHAVVDLYKNGAFLQTMTPEQRLYKADRQPASVVSIRRRLNEDVYLNFAGMNNDGDKAVIQAYTFPLVSWIWIGFWVLLVGNLICLVPSKVKLQFAKTDVVGVVASRKEVAVTQQS
jgi:cytochrome c-type biogenesis protein CcmF